MRFNSLMAGNSRKSTTILITAAVSIFWLSMFFDWRITLAVGTLATIVLLIFEVTHRLLIRTLRSLLFIVGTAFKTVLESAEEFRTAAAQQVSAQIGLPLPHVFTEPSTQSAICFILFAIIIECVIGLLLKQPAAGERTDTEPELHARSFRQRLEGFCQNLFADLNMIDVDTRWSTEYFVPLEAEVEEITQNRRTRRLLDLLSAIRRNHRDSLFLVLGDPGSGKSVALRMLCSQLLKQVKSNGLVPLYINLKEWTPKQRWTRESPPKISDLQEFIVANLKSRLGVFGIDFIDSYFNTILETGGFFVVFDSFDEIPAVLDVDDSSWLIEALSGVFEKFFYAGTASRGIIASRYFRRPRLSRQKNLCTLEVRPFSERKIAESFHRHGNIPDAQCAEILRKRPDLIPLARNPFTAGLIVDYLKQSNSLPRTKAEIYQCYIARRLAAAQDVLIEYNLTLDEVLDVAIEIAGHMFDSKDIGLDIAIPELERALPACNIPSVVEVLVAARIGRRSGSTRGRFSFVHRRFNEYFFVQYLLRSDSVNQLEAIPTDSKWRDALVLYSEVCSDEAAKHIATYCWTEVQRTSLSLQDDPRNYVRHVHCLRFLSDAFHGRPAPLVEFQTELFQHILAAVENGKDFLTKVIAVEAAGLLRTNHIKIVVIRALSLNIPWLSETAFNACRYISVLPRTIKYRLIHYLGRFDTLSVVSRYRELQFALQLSHAMKSLGMYWTLRLADLWSLCLAVSLLCVLRPATMCLAGLSFALVLFFVQAIIITRPTRNEDPQKPARLPFFLRIGSRSLAGVIVIYCSVISHLSLHLSHFHTFDPIGQLESTVVGRIEATLGASGCLLVLDLFLPLFVFPLHKLRYLAPYFTKDSRELRRLQRRIIHFLSHGWTNRLVIAVSILACMGIVVIAIEAAKRYSTAKWLFIVVIVAMLLIVFSSICRRIFCHARNYLADWKVFIEIKTVLPKTRAEIEAALLKLSLEYWQLRYLKVLPMEGIKPSGEWANGWAPILGSVRVNTELAKLEARWLGVER